MSKLYNRSVGSSMKGVTPGGGIDRKQKRTQKNVADTDQNFSITSDGVVKLGNHNYSKNIKKPYKLYANQDLVAPIGKKVNFKKRNKR